MKYGFIALSAASMTFSSLGLAEPSETDRSLAQSLFEQGKQLMQAGNLAQACPKLQESQRLDPGGGTLLNLALCHERQGRIASAWTEFKEALSMARRDGRQERIDAATEHIAALEPKLPYLTVTVAAPTEGEELRLDGAVVGAAAWGAPLSVDPGSHELRVQAPGKKTWSTSVSLAVAERRTLAVPPLEPEASAATAPVDAPAPARNDKSPTPLPQKAKSNVVGWVVGGFGVAAIGVGSYFGVEALSKRKQSTALCPSDTTCSPQGVTYNEDAYKAAWISNIGIGVGVVAVGVGTYLLLSSRKRQPTAESVEVRTASVTADVSLLSGGGAVRVSGKW